MSWFENLTLSEACQKGYEITRTLERKASRPANVAGMQAQVADRIVELHPAGNDRATTIGIFESEATAADIETAVNALA